MNARLTKEADALLCLLYKDYLDKRQDGVPKSQAKFLGGSTDIQERLVTKLSLQDTDETCWELHRSNMLYCQSGNNVACLIQLTDDGIIFMENRFKDGLTSVLDHLGKIKGLIPFI
ncbi:hypothetical protein PMSD_11715 [Paenibacillus macquariensis subsp. defensor]|nr:hypothetical protein PMSD_11715 [Paenibacillus macquariensis subsp. defensor]